MVSGDVQPEVHRRVMQLGALAFIKKPVDPVLVQNILTEYGIEIETTDRRRAVDFAVGHSERYQEIANIAMGRAGDLLARLLGAFVRLPAPKASMLNIPDLRGLLAQVQETVRETDIAGRYGGEEFAIVLVETNGEGALILTKRLRRAIEATTVVHDTHKIQFTVSLGVAQRDAELSSYKQWIDCAGRALYKAKESGRNQVVLFRKHGQG